MEQPAADIVSLDVDKIDPNPFLLRLDYHRNLEQLMNSLKLLGQLSPVRVRHHPQADGRYQLIFGHRRLEAAKRLGWTTIKAEVVSANDEEMFLTALAENLEADSLTDFEKGLALKILNQKFGKSYEEIARLIGRSKAYVAQHIAMTNLFNEEQLKKPEVRELLQHLTEGHASFFYVLRTLKIG
jgi:ParB family chromosome partitioning protein